MLQCLQFGVLSDLNESASGFTIFSNLASETIDGVLLDSLCFFNRTFSVYFYSCVTVRHLRIVSFDSTSTVALLIKEKHNHLNAH